MSFFLIGRNVVLSKLVMDQSEWGPSSRSRGSDLGQLVTDSKLSMANPYSYQVRSIGPMAHFLSSKKNHGLCPSQDSNAAVNLFVGQPSNPWA
jgi:hypothetical protein